MEVNEFKKFEIYETQVVSILDGIEKQLNNLSRLINEKEITFTRQETYYASISGQLQVISRIYLSDELRERADKLWDINADLYVNTPSHI